MHLGIFSYSKLLKSIDKCTLKNMLSILHIPNGWSGYFIITDL